MRSSIKYLLVNELHDILNAEKQIVKALPKVISAAESSELKKAFSHHLKETKAQIVRLGKIFRLLNVAKQERCCHAMKGLIEECKEVLQEFKQKSAIRDVALIAKAQRIEHYEVCVYGTLRTLAREIEAKEVVDLLQESLNEEGSANSTLNKIAEGGLLKSGVNHQANLEGMPKLKRRAAKKVKKAIKKRASPVKKARRKK